MEIDQEIQSRFRNERHRAGVNLIYTSNWYTDKISTVFRASNLTMPQFNILRILRGASPQPVSVKYIRERMLDKMSDVSRLVEKLREKGWVNRHECPEDRRNVNITLTPAGQSLLAQLDTLMESQEATFATLTDAELRQLNHLLDKLRG
ncbi:MAG: MarR family transcriptional regulator [Bernardetiaceae bacterium]|jgi:DNA-binding MarR family transcriptional regulator|nr:MarR family transcriptional regulator [Bernardetiaceae bacterium]